MTTRRIVGLLLIILSLGSLPLVHVLTRAWLRAVARADPVPDQGAMVIAYLLDKTSVGLAVGLALVGLCMLV